MTISCTLSLPSSHRTLQVLSSLFSPTSLLHHRLQDEVSADHHQEALSTDIHSLYVELLPNTPKTQYHLQCRNSNAHSETRERWLEGDKHTRYCPTVVGVGRGRRHDTSGRPVHDVHTPHAYNTCDRSVPSDAPVRCCDVEEERWPDRTVLPHTALLLLFLHITTAQSLFSYYYHTTVYLVKTQ